MGVLWLRGIIPAHLPACLSPLQQNRAGGSQCRSLYLQQAASGWIEVLLFVMLRRLNQHKCCGNFTTF